MGNCAYCHNPLLEGASLCGKCKAPVAPETENSAGQGARVSSKAKRQLFVAGAAFITLVLLSGGVNLIKNVTGTGNDGARSSQGSANGTIQVDDGLVPDFVGFDAYEAFKLSKDLGFSVDPYGLDGEYIYSYDVEYDQSLPGKGVCYQGLLPGSSYKEYEKLKLVIDVSCVGKKSIMLSGTYAAKANTWTPAITSGASALENDVLEGWVAGYGDKYSPERITLLTNYGEVTLALGFIEPISYWCQDGAFPDQDPDLLALQAVKDTAPLYSPVRVVFGESSRYDDTFMHRLDSSGALVDGEVPVNSINELLVKTGFWIPDAIGIDESEMKVDPLKRKWNITTASYFEPIELSYVKRIVSAANTLRLVPTNPLGVCVAAEKVYWDENYKDYYADLDANVSSVSGVGTGGGGGGGCYVRGHWRAGHWVNGYYRNC